MKTVILDVTVKGKDITYEDIQKIEDFLSSLYDAGTLELSIEREGGPGCNQTVVNFKFGDA